MFTTYTVADFRPQSAKRLRVLSSPAAAPFAPAPKEAESTTTPTGAEFAASPRAESAAMPTGAQSTEVPASAPAPSSHSGTPVSAASSPNVAPNTGTPALSKGKTVRGWTIVPFDAAPPVTQVESSAGSGVATAQPSGLQRLPINAAGVQAILVPEEWEQYKSNLPPGYGSIQTVGPISKKLTISIADRGQSLSPEGWRNFMNVLATADGATKQRPLSPSQIRSLAELFGKASVGDNQHTNTNRWAPYTFKMFSASAFVVNGRPVIEIEGQFLDCNGQRVRDHIGLYTLQRKKVTRLFLDAASKDDYIYGRWLYKYLLKTIEWV